MYVKYIEQHPIVHLGARAVQFTAQQKTHCLLKQNVQFVNAPRLHCLWHGPAIRQRDGRQLRWRIPFWRLGNSLSLAAALAASPAFAPASSAPAGPASPACMPLTVPACADAEEPHVKLSLQISQAHRSLPVLLMPGQAPQQRARARQPTRAAFLHSLAQASPALRPAQPAALPAAAA